MGAKSLCIPFEQPMEITADTKCVYPCGQAAKFYTLFGRSYQQQSAKKFQENSFVPNRPFFPFFFNVHFCAVLHFALKLASYRVLFRCSGAHSLLASKIRRRNPEYCFNRLGISSPLWTNETSNWPPRAWKIPRRHHELALSDSNHLNKLH